MKYEKVTNPLTIVSIFSGLAEIAGTTVTALLPPDLQAIFIWFLIFFPVLLVALFFITWNLNPKVLYPPSEYPNPDHYIALITRKHKSEVDNGIDEASSMLVKVKDDIKETVTREMERIANVNDIDLRTVDSILEGKIELIIDKLNSTKQSTSELIRSTSDYAEIGSQILVMEVLSSGRSFSINELCQDTKIAKPILARLLSDLVKQHVITSEGEGKLVKYSKST